MNEVKRIAASLISKTLSEFAPRNAVGEYGKEVEECYSSARIEVTWADDSGREFEEHLLHLLEQRHADLVASGLTAQQARSSVNSSGTLVIAVAEKTW